MKKKTVNKSAQIKALIQEAQVNLEKARVLSVDEPEGFYFDGPDYGMGGFLETGNWQASSGSC